MLNHLKVRQLGAKINDVKMVEYLKHRQLNKQNINNEPNLSNNKPGIVNLRQKYRLALQKYRAFKSKQIENLLISHISRLIARICPYINPLP